MMRCFEKERQYILIYCSLHFNIVSVLGGGTAHKGQACPLAGVLQNHRIMGQAHSGVQLLALHRVTSKITPQHRLEF